MGEMRNVYAVLVGKPAGGDHLEDLCIDERIILKWILGSRVGRCWLGSCGSG
jgi:hypothetical protein